MRVGTKKVSKAKKAVKSTMARTVKHKHVGSPAFDVNDPVQRLMFTIGSGFFGEDKFYDSLQAKDWQGHHTSKARTTKRSGRSVVVADNVKDALGFNETAQDLVSTLREIAESERFEDLLVLARWAREDLNLRQTPVMALALAARVESELGRGSGLIRKYAPYILRRADEPGRLFAAYRHMFMEGKDGMRKGTFPHQLARGMIKALQRFNEYQLLKYDNQNETPTFKDLALFLAKYEGRGKGRSDRKNMRPFSDAMWNYFVKGEVDADALPKVAARQKLFKRAKFDATAKKLAKEADITWENLVSQFGGTKAVWEWLVTTGQVPYMALVRNLANMEKADISKKAWNAVYSKLTETQKHRVLPFRFIAARDKVTGQHAKSAVDVALDNAVKNVPDLPGTTFIMVDASASMDHALSSKSVMTYKQAGYSMAAILAKRLGPRAIVGCFGDSFERVNFSAADSTMAIIQQLQRAGRNVGHSTNAWIAPAWLLGKADPRYILGDEKYLVGRKGNLTSVKEVDRIIIVSDMNCYNSRGGYGWNNAGAHNVPALLTEYRAGVNPEVFFYSINLGGGGQAKMDPQDDHTLLLSGFSEKIFTLFAQFEEAGGVKKARVDPETGETAEVEMPTIEELRNRFAVK
jgi:hypothetical protein